MRAVGIYRDLLEFVAVGGTAGDRIIVIVETST